ncbi:hypothetical protein [Pseudaminobacter soli (ex Li et al. 2025)]|uniref:Flagellar assembly protein FliH/Type III secretion system HrpE domain-containing protein n=1 Tax=Pseudaminobacter soli (ex Li et al. 2025) TaxID=1295366 RepID=A0A2P7SDV8_9HYPH|nr:hypothetical protein [Mesorhizobium soli]PSJ60696.1 hypothetical protein C7I85_11660 [Mesorhizobium soli]
MSALALSDLLQDFGKHPPRAGEATSASALRHNIIDSFIEPDPAPDQAEIIAEEVARAEAALAERLEQEHAEALNAEREHHAAEMDALARRLGEEAAATMSARLAEMEERISELTTTATARIVSGILSDTVLSRSLESLARSIREATADREAVRIKVSSPLSLFEALAEALPERAASFDHIEAPGFDLTVAIDEDIFETRLSEWSATLSEILS